MTIVAANLKPKDWSRRCVLIIKNFMKLMNSKEQHRNGGTKGNWIFASK
jgi:hypothetical protein